VTVTAVDHGAVAAPARFALQQNLPNPFNDRTAIRYSLPDRSHTTLKIYDALGREAVTLVYGIHDAGDWTVEWDSREAPSGVYFYRLEAGNHIQTRRLTLLK
jgi:hypothetical protein